MTPRRRALLFSYGHRRTLQGGRSAPSPRKKSSRSSWRSICFGTWRAPTHAPPRQSFFPGRCVWRWLLTVVLCISCRRRAAMRVPLTESAAPAGVVSDVSKGRPAARADKRDREVRAVAAAVGVLSRHQSVCPAPYLLCVRSDRIGKRYNWASVHHCRCCGQGRCRSGDRNPPACRLSFCLSSPAGGLRSSKKSSGTTRTSSCGRPRGREGGRGVLLGRRRSRHAACCCCWPRFGGDEATTHFSFL